MKWLLLLVTVALSGCVGLRPSERVLVDTMIENAVVLDEHVVTEDAPTRELIRQNRITADQLAEYLAEGD